MAANNRRQDSYSGRNSHAARSAHVRADREFRTYDTSSIQPKRSNVPAIVALIVVAVALIVILVSVFSCVGSWNTAGESTDTDLIAEGEEVTITIDQGMGATEIAELLADAGLVSSASSFVDFVTAEDAAGSLIPGTYVFSGGSSQETILNQLLSGPTVIGAVVTIPEGYTRAAIASAIDEGTGGAITADDFLAASADASVYVGDYSFLATAGSNPLEGFLFPKTYTITDTDDATSVVRMMLDQFQTETASLDWSYPESRGIDLYGAVTLASIVERETDALYRDRVASVFYNRLASDHPYLESDATTAYEVGREPTAEEVHADTPYSTYAHPGLPPTPICSPSIESIIAVCDPEETDYMFFYIFMNDEGETVYSFSETYEEHEEAIATL